MTVEPLSKTFYLNEWSINVAKITEYLLDLEHLDGSSKARFLLRRGFSPDDPEKLMDALIDHAKQHRNNCGVRARSGGDHLIIDGLLPTPTGAVLWRSIWRVEASRSNVADFITGYPGRK